MYTWQSWIESTWPRLVAKEHLPVPGWLPHPAQSPFVQEHISTPAGQCRDWVLSMTDGSRVHVHEFPDGRFVAHRDRHDPNRGLGSMLKHVFTETEIGQVALTVGVCAVVVSALENT